MDPERIRAYLQVACAGLGFDIGEVWWTSNENGSSTVAAIEERHDGQRDNESDNLTLSTTDKDGKKLRFVQLYTSKSFESRRSELVNPPEQQQDSNGLRRSSSTENLQKHVLSPRLVDAISKTTQVVWANTRRQEGLTGRSDIRLQTAVGMPVAMDASGNMCIVVMFSPNNIQSSDEAMEYLQSLSKSATSTSIPCLFPVCNTDDNNNAPGLLLPLPPSTGSLSLTPSNMLTIPQNALGEGVTARFVSLDDINNTESHTHELSQAPKDTFGIPMLPTVAELGGAGNVTPEESIDAFDEASYGIWNTIMDEIFQDPSMFTDNEGVVAAVPSDPSLQVVLPDQHLITVARIERLEEFLSAFLAMSVFDVADVWVPAASDGYPDCLRHVVSVMSGSITNNDRLTEFDLISAHTLIKFWTGGVGRAYSSGNPVWSCNPHVFVDAGRAVAFERAGIQTVLAVPVFSAKQALPTCVVSCYSLVKSNSVPFVLKFVQQALRLLWEGLDQFEPQNQNLKETYWRKINPADLGEMAADVEMQQHFLNKKRPHNLIATNDTRESGGFVATVVEDGDTSDSQSNLLATQLESIRLPSGEVVRVPLQLADTFVAHGAASDNHLAQNMVATANSTAEINMQQVQEHLAQALRSVQNAVPFSDHAPTNAEGSKRAHLMPSSMSAHQDSPSISSSSLGPINTNTSVFTPLPMPRPFPSHVVSSTSASPNSSNHSSVILTPSNTSTTTAQPRAIQSTSQLLRDPRRREFTPQLFVSNAVAGPPKDESPGQLQFQTISQQHQQQQQQQQQQPLHVQQPALLDLASYALSQQHHQQQQHEQQFLLQSHQLTGEQQSVTLPSMAMAESTSTPTSGISDSPQPGDLFCQAVNSNLVLIGSKSCRIVGCDSPALSRRPYCEAHSGNRICEYEGCSKCAQGCTRFCIAHGGGRRCTFPGCDKGARDKFFCAAHGGGKRCCHNGCNKSAVGGSDLCTSHGGGRRCEVDGCDKSAQSSTRFCVKHGGGKKCAQDGCEKVARGRTNYCAAHGGGVRCKLEGCNRVAIGKMQLCRAHGGSSSRSRKRDGGVDSTPSPVFDMEDQQYGRAIFQQEAALASTTSTSINFLAGV